MFFIAIVVGKVSFSFYVFKNIKVWKYEYIGVVYVQKYPLRKKEIMQEYLKLGNVYQQSYPCRKCRNIFGV